MTHQHPQPQQIQLHRFRCEKCGHEEITYNPEIVGFTVKVDQDLTQFCVHCWLQAMKDQGVGIMHRVE